MTRNPRRFIGSVALLVCALLAPLAHATEQGANPIYLPFVTSSTRVSNPAPAAPSPQPTSVPVPNPMPVGWLTLLNTYRALAGLAPVTEESAWSSGGALHAKYVVKNDELTHNEDADKPYYTSEGQLAGQNGNVMSSSGVATTDEQAVTLWMRGPFHGLGIIDPRLTRSGFGSYREADGGIQMAATLDVLRGLADVPVGVTFPIMWPGDGKTTLLTSYSGSEFPDPLTSCAGYGNGRGNPTGAPIYLQLGTGNLTPNVTAYSLQQNGLPLPVCAFDETNYTNSSNADAQRLGRAVLDGRDAIVLMPKQPLTPGTTYTASVTTNGQTYTWSFSVSSDAR